MSNVIGVVDYGVAGNIHSIKKALEKAGSKVIVVNEPSELLKIDKLILPGVGSFKDAMKEIDDNGLREALCKHIREKPTLGICLGMQVLAKVGYEFGQTQGMGLINAEVKPMLCSGTVPHMGFNNIEVVKKNPILDGIEDESFYFMHSYEVVNYTDVAALTTYCDHQFVSSIAKEHLYGVQFHPEKSRDAGIRLFKNFINL